MRAGGGGTDTGGTQIGRGGGLQMTEAHKPTTVSGLSSLDETWSVYRVEGRHWQDQPDIAGVTGGQKTQVLCCIKCFKKKKKRDRILLFFWGQML